MISRQTSKRKSHIRLVQGAVNVLQVDLGFDGQIGGSATGICITISGLKQSGSPSTNSLKLAKCSSCEQPEYTDISTLLADSKRVAQWDQQSGELSFCLRSPGPTYIIDETVLRAFVPILNSKVSQTGSIPVVTVEPGLWRGVRKFDPTPLGSRPILRSHIPSQIIFGHVDYYQSTAYARPAIILRLTMTYDTMYGDRVIIRAPSLTTCSTFCHEGKCRQVGCGASNTTLYVSSSQTSPGVSSLQGHMNASVWGSGDGLDFMTATWSEADKRLVLQLSAGRALCEGQEAFFILSPAGCANESIPTNRDACLFQVLPDDFFDASASLVETEISGCRHSWGICEEYGGSSLSSSPVVTEPGFYWAQVSDTLDNSCQVQGPNATAPQSTNWNARSWFSASMHNEILYVLGGITPCGYAESTRLSGDGIEWKTVREKNTTGAFDAPSSPFPRVHFSSESFRGFLWVFGGQHPDSGRVVNDIWRSQDGSTWETVIEAAEWEQRKMHASVVFRDQLWLIAGQNNASRALSDVWYTMDGRNWTMVTSLAPFAARFGHSMTVFMSRMWLYSGGETESDVWWSINGAEWKAATLSAPWPNRRASVALSFDGRLWLIGGYRHALQTEALTDVWSSADGEHWVASTLHAQWGPRYGAQAVVLQNRFVPVFAMTLFFSSNVF